MDTPARVLRSGRWPGMRGERVETWGPHGARVPVKGFEKSMLAMNRRPLICDDCGEAFKEPTNHFCRGDGDNLCRMNFHIRKIFCDSNSDFLDLMWPIETFAHFLDVQRRCPDVTLINCTKRPENFFPRMSATVNYLAEKHNAGGRDEWICGLLGWLNEWITYDHPHKNITLLTSVENQPMADKRVRDALKIPAACRGLSLEPLLGPVDLMKVKTGSTKFQDGWALGIGIDWLIIGCESGPRRRPCNLEWIESLVEQGLEAGVPVWVKQISMDGKVETDMSKFPKHLQIREWPKGF